MEINTNIDTEKKIEKQVDILRDVVIFSESDEKNLKLLASFLTDVFVVHFGQYTVRFLNVKFYHCPNPP